MANTMRAKSLYLSTCIRDITESDKPIVKSIFDRLSFGEPNKDSSLEKVFEVNGGVVGYFAWSVGNVITELKVTEYLHQFRDELEYIACNRGSILVVQPLLLTNDIVTEITVNFVLNYFMQLYSNYQLYFISTNKINDCVNLKYITCIGRIQKDSSTMYLFKVDSSSVDWYSGCHSYQINDDISGKRPNLFLCSNSCINCDKIGKCIYKSPSKLWINFEASETGYNTDDKYNKVIDALNTLMLSREEVFRGFISHKNTYDAFVQQSELSSSVAYHLCKIHSCLIILANYKPDTYSDFEIAFDLDYFNYVDYLKDMWNLCQDTLPRLSDVVAVEYNQLLRDYNINYQLTPRISEKR
jgi:hypothetical protein